MFLMEKILVISAHPDDETLGLGGTLALHSKNKDKISILILTDGESGRKIPHQKISSRKKQANEACKILGIDKINFLDLPDQKLDTFPLLEIAKKIENEIDIFKPTIVYTHFWGDTNQDHQQIFKATKIATRPLPSSSVKKLICYEIPSSSELGKGHDSFSPNLFVNIEKTFQRKISAIKKYKHEIHPFPHPRSIDAITARSQNIGSSVGVKFAEAFFIVFDIQ